MKYNIIIHIHLYNIILNINECVNIFNEIFYYIFIINSFKILWLSKFYN